LLIKTNIKYFIGRIWPQETFPGFEKNKGKKHFDFQKKARGIHFGKILLGEKGKAALFREELLIYWLAKQPWEILEPAGN